MDVLFWAALGFFVLATVFLPWFNRASIARLKDDVSFLRGKVDLLERGLAEKSAAAPAPAEPGPAAAAFTPWQVPAAPRKTEEGFVFFSDEGREMDRAATQPARVPRPSEKAGLEMQFGARLPVWIGGVALALAGFYLVKYSIDMGLLSPAVRSVLGTLFGAALLLAGNYVRGKPDFANGTRIGQALSGAGIADLYACIFAATNVYHLLPPALGFAGMAATTAAAVVLSLRHGAPIALLGMLGGFLTPALMGSDHPSAFLLFTYLYFVLAGLMAVIRRREWWPLGLLVVAGAFAWVALWLLGGAFMPGDGLWLGLFLLAVSGTVFGFSSWNRGPETARPYSSAMNYLAVAGALVLMGFTAGKSGFDLMTWGMFGLLAAGGIAMAYFRQSAYALVPWLSLGVNGVMLAVWQPQDSGLYAAVLCAFSALYIASGTFLQWRVRAPLMWAGQAVAAALGFYLLGYFRLHDEYAGFHLWSGLAFVLAAIAIATTARILSGFAEDRPQKQHLLALYAAAATAFVSVGLTVELDREFLSVAAAFEVLALAWIYTRVDIPALRRIAGIVAAGFGVLLLPQAMLVLQLASWSLFEAGISAARDVPIVQWPLFQLGLPAACFLAASVLLRRKGDDSLVRAFEVACIVLTGLTGYYFTRHILHPGENILFVKAGFAERGLITNAVFAFGLACLMAGRTFERTAVSSGGLVLMLMGMFRVGYFDLLIHNPMWDAGQNVGELPLLNMLPVTYGLPVFWLARAVKELPRLNKGDWAGKIRVFMLALSFALVTFEVRQFFHGANLYGGTAGGAEIYAYSAAWLLFGLVLLFLGTLRKDAMIRAASLAVMILAVGKVFLFDAAALTGLYRVFSFFGLGMSLLGLSWFYSRFVFPRVRE